MKGIHENIRHPCEQCDYQATTKGNLTVHVQFKHEGKKYPCKICGYQATTLSNYNKHLKCVHKDNQN